MIIEKLKPEHIAQLLPNIEPSQRFLGDLLHEQEYIEYLCENFSYTAIHDDRVLCIAGSFDNGNSCGRVWAAFSKHAGPHMLKLTRLIHMGLAAEFGHCQRMEAVILRGFGVGHRWLSILGFTKETNKRGLKSYGFDGETYDLYGLTRDEYLKSHDKRFK